MPVLYEAFQSNMENKDGQKLFYPRVVRSGNVNTAQIAKEIAVRSSLSAGDVKNTLDNLVAVMAMHLKASESITLDGFGTFRIVMNSKGKGVPTADAVSASQATLNIRFCSAYTRHPDKSMAARPMLGEVKCTKFEKAARAFARLEINANFAEE